MEFKLIIKKIHNELTAEEQVEFDKWYAESEKHRSYFKNVSENYRKPPGKIDVEKAYHKIIPRLTGRKTLLRYTAVAAAAVIAAIIAIPFFVQKENIETSAPVTKTESQIKIGTDKAVLTLDDGTRVALEKGSSYKSNNASSNGSELVYDPAGTPEPVITYNTLTIPRGGQFFITLADGTKVWLNSETELKYPVNFIKGKPRKVELVYGEAYFDVSPGSQHNGSTFLVTSQNQNIEVLGTEFNVRAYKSDSYIATTLVEGKVTVGHQDLIKELTPGNQSKLNLTTHTIQISPVDIQDEISWKEGLFSFKNKTLEEIMLQLSRWYNVAIEIENTEAGRTKFNGVFNKNQHLENILLIIENTNEAKFEKIENKIIMK